MSKFVASDTRAEALKKVNGDASTITTKVCGGYMIFDTVEDLKIWRKQK